MPEQVWGLLLEGGDAAGNSGAMQAGGDAAGNSGAMQAGGGAGGDGKSGSGQGGWIAPQAGRWKVESDWVVEVERRGLKRTESNIARSKRTRIWWRHVVRSGERYEYTTIK